MTETGTDCGSDLSVVGKVALGSDTESLTSALTDDVLPPSSRRVLVADSDSDGPAPGPAAAVSLRALFAGAPRASPSEPR